MSADQRNEPGASQLAQRSVPENSAPYGEEAAEQSLVKLYMNLTGESESQARGVLMFVDPDREKPNTRSPD